MISPIRQRRLGRKPHQRRTLLRNLVTSLILYESIRTTRSRAEAAQPLLERMIHRAKTHPARLALRELQRIVTDEQASRKTLEVLVPRFQSRSSGFTRILPLGRRKGDGAELVEFSLLQAEGTQRS